MEAALDAPCDAVLRSRWMLLVSCVGIVYKAPHLFLLASGVQVSICPSELRGRAPDPAEFRGCSHRHARGEEEASTASQVRTRAGSTHRDADPGPTLPIFRLGIEV